MEVPGEKPKHIASCARRSVLWSSASARKTRESARGKRDERSGYAPQLGDRRDGRFSRRLRGRPRLPHAGRTRGGDLHGKTAAGADRSSPGARRRGAALRGGGKDLRGVVDAFRFARARRADADGVERSSHARRSAGRAPPGRGEPERPVRGALPERRRGLVGEAPAHFRRVCGQSGGPRQRLQSVQRLGQRVLCDRRRGQRAQLAQTRANLPPLEKALAQTRNQLAVLIGKFPHDARLPELDLAAFQLPQNLPVSLPSDLVRQRPDIRSAETVLHQTNARIGVAQALMFPQLTLSGSFGRATTRSSELFSAGTQIWNVGASLLQPIFHAGQLQARKRGAQAAYDQAFAQYQQTVLAAFQNVADVLFALEFDAVALKAQADAEAAARESLDMTIKQLQFGSASYLALFNAQRQYEQAKIGLVQAQAARYADTAALFQALGGGWWERAGEAPSAPAK